MEISQRINRKICKSETLSQACSVLLLVRQKIAEQKQWKSARSARCLN